MTAGGTRMVEIESCDGSVGSLKSKLDAVSVEERDSLGQDEKTTDTEQLTHYPEDARSIESTGCRKSVSFKAIEIREYPMRPGDNPSVTTGVPITIDWCYDGELTCSVDDYEEHKSAPRSMAQLRMPSKHRDAMMKRLGFSSREINQGVKAANIARNQRKKTIELMGLAGAQEWLEKAKKGTLNSVFRRGAKKKERSLLEQFKAQDELDRSDSMETASLSP